MTTQIDKIQRYNDKDETKKSDKVILSVNSVDLYIDNTERLCFTSDSITCVVLKHLTSNSTQVITN